MEASAADVAGMEISSQADTVRKGQEIELTFSLEGYTDINSGVNALKGTLEYDSAVFGGVSQEDFETVNSWEKLFYNPENGQRRDRRRSGCCDRRHRQQFDEQAGEWQCKDRERLT